MEVVHLVSRGDASSSYAVWAYSGSPFSIDALTVTVDKDICLVGTGVLVGPGSTKFKMNVYDGTNAKGSTPIYTGDEMTFTRTSKNTDPIKYKLREGGVILKANQLYTIEHHQKGPDSFKVYPAQTTVTQDGVTFKFGNANQSPNHRRSTTGQIPCLWFQKTV